MCSDPTEGAQAVAPGGGPPAMLTRLRGFSDRFGADVAPVLEPVQRAAGALEGASERLAVRALLPTLRDLAHQMRALTEKVSQQHAYVLIFGPLKSGKSTFINAICSAYVSEVTSLPAYPCIVKVAHGQTPAFVVTRYDGRSETFTARRTLHEVLLNAHEQLMAAVREAEAAGEEFDPATHMPEAVRTVEVKVPLGEMAESGAVLVDTPGLYTRMKFGYERLTRDFRDAAACAIFVVKSDNLFLEQVFEEFHELLDLFSRVFLVVNLDVLKRDLRPDGALEPSLERDDPERLIRAFRDLSMTAPLKSAADEGRLSIYPVDLLGAASRRLRAARGDDAPDDVSDDDDAGVPGRENFDLLLRDLTEYLNSSEYLRAFMADSVRRAASLLSALTDLAASQKVAALAADAEVVREELARAEDEARAVGRLKWVEWQGQSAALRESLREAAEERAANVRQAAANAVTAAVDDWFGADGSLAELIAEGIAPHLKRCREDLHGFLRDRMREDSGRAPAMLELSEEVQADLRTAGLDLAALATGTIDGAGAPAPKSPLLAAAIARQVPVSKSFWDWLLFRSRKAVAKRLFGPLDDPRKPVPRQVKAKRLAEPAREALHRLAAERVDKALDDAVAGLPDRLVTDFLATMAAALDGELARREARTQTRIADLQTKLRHAEPIIESMGALRDRAAETSEALAAIRERFTGQE